MAALMPEGEQQCACLSLFMVANPLFGHLLAPDSWVKVTQEQMDKSKSILIHSSIIHNSPVSIISQLVDMLFIKD